VIIQFKAKKSIARIALFNRFISNTYAIKFGVYYEKMYTHSFLQSSSDNTITLRKSKVKDTNGRQQDRQK
jgi:hypothetical protein